MNEQHDKSSSPQRNPAGRILLAEDDAEMRTLLSEALRQHGYVVVECAHGGHLLTYLAPLIENEAGTDYDLLISDIRMPGVTGMEVVEGLAALPDCPPVILTTAFGDAETHDHARSLGVARLFDKPFEVADLVAAVREVLNHSPQDERHVED